MTRMREIHWLRRIKLPYVALAVTAIAVLLPFGCLDQDPLDGRVDPNNPNSASCLDEDGDGFGKGCAKGIDCDDSNAEALDECYRCVSPDKGCPCTSESEQAGCGKVEMAIGTQLVCGQGITTCSNGAWGECIINNSVTLAPPMPGLDPLGLGGPTQCTNNPCDPACITFNDTPGGLTNIDAGIISADGGDAGITLPGSVPPAPITCMGGSDGTCAHALCTVGTKLTAGCDAQVVPQVVFEEDFSDNLQGWTVSNTQWKVAVAAVAGSGQNLSGGFNDPGTDHTTTNTDNKIAGFVIGPDSYGGSSKGNAATSPTHAAYYLTSPPLNTAGTWGVWGASGATVTLKFWRWLNSEVPSRTIHNVQVCNGGTCVNLWANTTTVKDNAWNQVTYTIPAANVQANMTIRFGIQRVATTGARISSWNIDDIEITRTLPAPPTSCVSQVCAAGVMPSCCTTAWTIECVQQLFATCDVTCGSLNGVCVTCWNDSFDHDGDTYTGADNDCADCDPTINPSAYDFGGDFVDQDCSGAADDEPTSCDSGLAVASTNAYDFAKAMELCQTTTLGSKDWGVITPGAKFVQANVNLADGTGAALPNAIQYGIVPHSGTNNPPRKGVNMAMFSSGTARAPLATGWINPNGSGFQANTATAMPNQFPKNKAGCPAAQANEARDSSGLWMMIRTPSNAKSFSFKFNVFSAEYPEWVCTEYNDTFIARLLTGFLPANAPANGNNISFDANNNPVTVNNAFFTVPGCSNCTSPLLNGTNLDGACGNDRCGGATDWLYSAAPVNPSEIIRMNFEIWDEGDSQWDSWVVIDDWQWSIETTSIQTGKVPPGQPVIYTDGYFVRDYDLTGICPTGTRIVWGLWSWNATTPSTSSIDFKVQTASSLAGLAGAPNDALKFSDPPGPAGLAGQNVVARTGPPSTITGSAVVEKTLLANNRPINLPFLRITSHLAPSMDKLNAPILKTWNLQTSCVPSE